MKRNHQTHQRGAVLLLSVLILASVTAVAGGIAALIATDVRSNQNVDQGVQAFYQAESGLESGLDTVRKNRTTGVCSNSTNSCQQDSDCTPGICVYKSFSQTLTAAMTSLPGVSVRTTATGTSRSAVAKLDKDQSVQMNIYDPDSLL